MEFTDRKGDPLVRSFDGEVENVEGEEVEPEEN